MRCVLALCLTLLCSVDKSYATFAEFMNNLPSEVANAFRVAWGSITDAIKKPVKMKRFGPGGKHKSTTETPTTEISIDVGSSTPKHKGKGYFVPTTTSVYSKLKLPMLSSPRFQSIKEWRNMQKALYAERQKLANPAPILIFEEAAINKPHVREKYDDNSFATQMNF